MSAKSTDPGLAEELPFWDFEDMPFAHAVLNDGSLVSGLRVGLIDIECMTESEVNHLTSSLRAALNSVSEGVTLQFVMGVRSDYKDVLAAHRDGKETDIHPLVRTIANYREAELQRALDNGELYRPKLEVYLRTPVIQTKGSGFFKKKEVFVKNAAESYEETLEILGQNLDALISAFESAGLSCLALSKDEILNRVYEFLNPRRSKLEPSPTLQRSLEADLPDEILENSEWLAAQSPREQLVFGDLVLDFEQFTLDAHYHRVVTLKTLPEVTVAGQLADFLRLPFHYDLILSLEVPAQAGEMAKLQQKRKMAHSMASTQAGRASDLESETKLNSTEELIRELLNSGQRIYSSQMSVVLRAPASAEGEKVLDRQVREVLSRFRGLQGAEGLEETVGAWKVLKGNLPAAPVTLERARKMKTNNLADFLPVYGPREGDQDPVVIFRNRLNGLTAFDNFSPALSNFNSLVTGSSGSGKSFLINCILTAELARNQRVFIIDIGGSYKKLTEALDGQYLEMDLSDRYRLNPFDIPDPCAEPSTQKIKSLLACVESMVAEDDNSKLPRLDRVLLEKTIIELYAEKRIQGKVPILSDLMDALLKSEEASLQSIGKMLFIWTGDRPFGRLLDGQGGLNAEASICTFDLKGLSSYPDLQCVMILILTDFILTQVEQDKSQKKRIILDEAWQLLKSSAASFMEYCARTLRKTGSGITFITQGLDEIVASGIGPAILNNTATKFVMLQRGDTELLANTLKLNDQELALIQSLQQRKGEFSEGFLIEGDHRQVIRIYPSAFEYWLSTSDARDNQFLEELRNQGLNLVEAIEKAALTYPLGVALGPAERRTA